MTEQLDEDRKSIFCGGLSPKVTEDVLYELFLQAGPIARLALPKDMRGGSHRGFGFITFAHQASVKYAVDLLNDIPLYDRKISVRLRYNAPDELPAQPETPQNFTLDVSTLTPLEQPLMMPSPMQYGNSLFNMNPFGNMPMYPSQMTDNAYNNQLDHQNNSGIYNRNSYNQNWNNRNYEERNFERNYDRSNDRQDRNFDRSNNRDHGRYHSRGNDRNHDWNDRNSEPNFDRHRNRHDGDRRNDHGSRSFNRNSDYGNSSNDRDFDRSRKREFSASDDYSSHKKRRHRQ